MSPEAFKTAVEQRLRNALERSTNLGRQRQLLVFDRLLARFGVVFGDSVTLKGGLVLEVRLDRARTTKDIDVRFDGEAGEILTKLQSAGRLDLGDYMTFEVREDEAHPELRGDGIRYDGYRYRAECRLAGKLYGQPFGIDVAIGDPMIREPELFVGRDLLAFAGIEPPRYRIYPVETHVAEKLHAYTLPRDRPNSRVKDLPDLGLLGTSKVLSAEDLRSALEQTFEFRGTHALPQQVPAPPLEWEEAYAAMAAESGLAWTTLSELTVAVREFLNPVLSGGIRADWEPARWRWSERES